MELWLGWDGALVVGAWLPDVGLPGVDDGRVWVDANMVGDFTLAVTPASVALTAGGATQQITVTSTAVNGYNAQIAIAISGLPAGVTASPASVMITPGATATITLTAAATAATSSGTVTITGTSGANVHSGDGVGERDGGASGGLYAGGESDDGECDGGWGERVDGRVGERDERVQCGGGDCGERVAGGGDGGAGYADGHAGNAADAYADGGGECGCGYEHDYGDGDVGCAGAYGDVYAEGGGGGRGGLYAGD